MIRIDLVLEMVRYMASSAVELNLAERGFYWQVCFDRLCVYFGLPIVKKTLLSQ
jgi:hypothetical protein